VLDTSSNGEAGKKRRIGRRGKKREVKRKGEGVEKDRYQ